MEAAYALVTEIIDYPVEECGETLVSLPETARDAGVEVAFSQTQLAEGYDRIFFLREGLIGNYVAAAREMNDRGWVLKIEDGYRSADMQRELGRKESIFDAVLQRVMWEHGGRVPSAELMLRRLTVLVATFPKTGTHMSGSALDISVLRADDGAVLDRGGPYLEMSELTPMGSPFVSAEAQHNRAEITALMARHGFIAYPYEFWHYSAGDAYTERLTKTGKPARYGPVDRLPDAGSIRPIKDPKEPLHSTEEILSAIQSSLERLKTRPP